MDTLADNSFAFAQVLGIIFLVGGINAVFNRKSMSAAISGVAENPALFWVWGFINLFLGAIIVGFHSTWSSDWRVIITIIGWAGVIKGAFLMLLPNFAKTLYRTSNTSGVLVAGGIVAILLGLFLLYVGLGL